MFGFLSRLFKRQPQKQQAVIQKKSIFGFLLRFFARYRKPKTITEQKETPPAPIDDELFSDGLAIDDSDLEGGEICFDNDDMLSMEEINLAIQQADKQLG